MAEYEVLVAEALTQCLIREGIDRVFGIPSGYFNHLFSAFARAGLPSVEGRHEGAAACMAAGYAQAKDTLGVVYTQSGAGTTNALTGVASAYMDSIPMLLMASQIALDDYGRDAHQESTGATRGIDQLDIFRSTAAVVARPPTANSLVRMMRLAMSSARARREPAILEIASNLLSEKVCFEDRGPESYRSGSEPIDLQGIEMIARRLRAARRPVILAGDRLAHRGVAGELVAFCEENDVACATVDYTKGIVPEDHPLSLGVLGQAGHESTVEYLREADLLIAIGVRLTHATTIRYDRRLFENLIQIDSDPEEIGRCFPIGLGVVGSIPATMRALRQAAGGFRRRETKEIIAELRKKHAVYDEPVTRSEGLTTPRLLKILRARLPRETLIVADTGLTAQLLKRHFPVYAREGFFSLYGMAAMGAGLPMALGVQLARPDAVVVSIIGDGGFLTHTGELSVAAQHDLPVIHVVVNNGGYKQIQDRLVEWFKQSYATSIQNPSFARLAESFGCDGYSCTTPSEVDRAIGRAVERRRPAVIEVRVEGDNLLDIMPAGVRSFMNELFKDPPTGWPFSRPGPSARLDAGHGGAQPSRHARDLNRRCGEHSGAHSPPQSRSAGTHRDAEVERDR